MSDPRPRPGGSEELRDDTAVGRLDLTRWDTGLGRLAARGATAVGRRIGAHPALALTLAVGTGAAFLLTFLVARVYDAVTERDGVAALDLPILHAAEGLRSPALDGFAAGVAYLFGPVGMPIMAVAALLVLSLRRRSWTPAILVAAAGIGSLLMTLAGKDIIGRHRPLLADAIPPYEFSPSFPSGHTLNAAAIAGIVGYLIWLRRHTIMAKALAIGVPVVVALVVGLTRILLGAHWFTDVLAAWLLGAAWLAVVVTAHRLYLTARQRGAPERPPELRRGDQERARRRLARGHGYRPSVTTDLSPAERAFLGRPNPAVMATLAADGRPVTVATWYLLEDDGSVLLNLDAGRTRLTHVRRDPRVALDVLDEHDWYRHLSLQLVARSVEDDPDLADIDRLSVAYTGSAYSNRDRPRVSVRAEILRVLDWGATTPKP